MTKKEAMEVAEKVREAVVEHFAEEIGECVGSDGMLQRAVESCYKMNLWPLVFPLIEPPGEGPPGADSWQPYERSLEHPTGA